MCNETTELVPPLPDKEAQARLVQIVVGGGAALMALLMVIRLLFGSSSKGDKKKAGATPAAAKANGKPGDEWLAGTVSSSGLPPPLSPQGREGRQGCGSRGAVARGKERSEKGEEAAGCGSVAPFILFDEQPHHARVRAAQSTRFQPLCFCAR